jgi:hypothetical protein
MGLILIFQHTDVADLLRYNSIVERKLYKAAFNLYYLIIYDCSQCVQEKNTERSEMWSRSMRRAMVFLWCAVTVDMGSMGCSTQHPAFLTMPVGSTKGRKWLHLLYYIYSHVLYGYYIFFPQFKFLEVYFHCHSVCMQGLHVGFCYRLFAFSFKISVLGRTLTFG